MKHQPFEAWILSDDPLGEDERRELSTHLQTCDACRTLQVADRELTGMLNHAPMSAPAPGFRTRFVSHLEEQRRMRRLVRILVVSGFILALMAVVSLLVGGVLFARVVPVTRAVAGIGQFVVQLGFQTSLSLRVLRLVVVAFISTLPQAVWLAAMIAAIGLTGLWLFSLYRISSQPVRR